MKSSQSNRQHGFTLLETVIAIGVLAVLLTGFMVVFAPAAEGIRKSINVQQADRLASTLEQELTTPRNTGTALTPGFDKAFNWIKDSNNANTALLVYQYRADLTASPRSDGTPQPQPQLKNKLPGKDYVVVPMVRQKSDQNLDDDLEALEGAVYLVKCTQLVFDNGELKLGSAGTIKDPKGTGGTASSPDAYTEAVIAFAADFHLLPARTYSYLTSSAFTTKFGNARNPVFSRNLAVRR
ncbi:MAG: type II secretion system protein [Verrucomicrobiaceae bacterium]|nr:MAG: type II secretion system protein [Verrucomicrobiaceae bacterium]